MARWGDMGLGPPPGLNPGPDPPPALPGFLPGRIMDTAGSLAHPTRRDSVRNQESPDSPPFPLSLGGQRCER